MIPQSYSLHEPHPFTQFMKGKTVCSEVGRASAVRATAHKIAETGGVYRRKRSIGSGNGEGKQNSGFGGTLTLPAPLRMTGGKD